MRRRRHTFSNDFDVLNPLSYCVSIVLGRGDDSFAPSEKEVIVCDRPAIDTYLLVMGCVSGNSNGVCYILCIASGRINAND